MNSTVIWGCFGIAVILAVFLFIERDSVKRGWRGYRQVRAGLADPPKPGEQWLVEHEPTDPWDTRDPFVVSVVDVKEGWVRYNYPGSHWSADEKVKIKDFVGTFKKKAA